MARCDAREHGAVGDGGDGRHRGHPGAIDAAAEDDGGTVVVPSGEYVRAQNFIRSA